MASPFGYKPPTFGQPQPTSSPVGYRSLASALATPSPLTMRSPISGLGGQSSGVQVGGLTTTLPRVAQAPPPSSTGANISPANTPNNTSPTPNPYDLSADPIFQQIKSYAGMSNDSAQATALKQRQQLLLSYGSPDLASAVLGSNDPYVTAAGQNPTSTLAQLSQQHSRIVQNLEDQLNADNLFYSGYRARELGQAEQDYENQLAGAAGNAQSGLDQIASNLAAALGANQDRVIAGLNDAYNRGIASPPPGAAPTDTTTSSPPPGQIGGPGEVQPPNTSAAQPVVTPQALLQIVNALYRGAGGGPAGSVTPTTSTTRRI